jgi:hypothetical protein
MKRVIIVSAGLTIVSGIVLTAYVIISSFWLSVIVVSILIVLTVAGIFSLGAWKREKDIEKWLMAGIKLARDEHEIVSRYDDGIVKAFSGFANQILKTKQDAIEISRPALPNAMPSGFIIEGLKPKQLVDDIEELDD